ncbi:MAG: peptidoglycan-binding protein [Acidobacteriota bacterium]|nr:peptidoglycan-binding protein [Acidobacteriota bacterium]
MKKILFVLIASFLLGVSISAQTSTPAASQTQTNAKPKKQIFRANKEQVSTAQKMLKEKGLYAGAVTGKLDPDTRAAIKNYQGANGLKNTGTLNRATLEKMGVVLTDAQKQIPVSANSFASSDSGKAGKSDKPKRGAVFRANKDQVMQAQKILKAKGMYSGEETGKLDDATREGLKKFQEANNLKVTGTLNQVTLEKLGVILTDKQKEMGVKSPDM